MSTRASSRFVDVVGEERIDPHEEEATVVITVWFEVVNDESMWKLDKARLNPISDTTSEQSNPDGDDDRSPADMLDLIREGSIVMAARCSPDMVTRLLSRLDA